MRSEQKDEQVHELMRRAELAETPDEARRLVKEALNLYLARTPRTGGPNRGRRVSIGG